MIVYCDNITCPWRTKFGEHFRCGKDIIHITSNIQCSAGRWAAAGGYQKADQIDIINGLKNNFDLIDLQEGKEENEF